MTYNMEVSLIYYIVGGELRYKRCVDTISRGHYIVLCMETNKVLFYVVDYLL